MDCEGSEFVVTFLSVNESVSKYYYCIHRHNKRGTETRFEIELIAI